MSFTALLPEVFEEILAYLDVDTVKALRLIDKNHAEKCLGPRFLRSLQQPIFDITPHNLRSLYALACNPILSKEIHSLTLVATSLDHFELEKSLKSKSYVKRQRNGVFFSASTIRYSPEDLANAESDFKWLKEQQEARANESESEMIEFLQLALKEFGELRSIHLDAAAIVGPSPTQRLPADRGSWHPIWMRASQVFTLVVTAMVQSKVSVKDFNGYRSTPRCCIPSGHITSLSAQLEKFGKLNNNLESLGLSMSGEIHEIAISDEPSTESLHSPGLLSRNDSSAIIDSWIPGITCLLQSALSLRKIDLSFRQTHQKEPFYTAQYNRIFESIAYETEFPLLEECAFFGFSANEESILAFLQNHPDIRSFALCECALISGSWASIFSHLESMPKLEDLNLSNLFGKYENEDGEEETHLINLHPIWDNTSEENLASFVHSGGRLTHTRSFDREALKKGLVFRPYPGGYPYGSYPFMHWQKTRGALYGSP